MKPTSGRGVISGYDVLEEPAKVREVIGYVPQDLTVDDDLTGYENLMLHASLYHLARSEAKAKAREVLRFMELERFADKKVETYSGGMKKKRLEIGCALIHQPQVLFLDEPTPGLDVQTRARIWDYIRLLSRDHDVTIFLTTHYMDEADSLCDRVAIIDNGRIKAIDTTTNLKTSIGGDLIELEVAHTNSSVGEAISSIRGVNEVSQEDGVIRIWVERGELVMPQLLGELIRLGVDVRRAEMKRQSLDEVFLRLTGRSLRDMGGCRDEIMRRNITIRRMRRS
jgi:ABC-2 type transport system ATP-binding protein